jgi:hypothetical protein
MGKSFIMLKFARSMSVVGAAGLASLFMGTVVTPAVSSADCAPGTEWWDPVANVCRPTGAPMKNCLPSGWWDPTISDCRPF